VLWIYLIYLREKWIRNLVLFLYFFYLAFLFSIRVVLPSLTLLNVLLFPCFVIELPGARDPHILNALSTLNYYLSLNEQDPEWVNWVQRELSLSERTPDAELAQRIYGFISLEEGSLIRNAVIETFKHLYYSSGAYPPVKAYIIDSCLRSTLEQQNLEFDGPALESVLTSLRILQGNSTFFDR